ncbi:MAG: hypothetical protein A3H60_02790 [Candidatus Zambryskibacteria bacterium RIFCSPLOWO2_02_FULL_44_12b]|uniref:Elongation factor Ts n=1 Tax=Candidatus Zambryskibacteria bacterium RIFCSPLOWO2_02_FULL_44_12b TaxID=1802772 RepID=A0A1G2ULS2_9BACT|nr:MAG: hypothetical protein A3H60_02790 [Candidatus Zambryskibacteria bacterium RIFCSPLOWO2_02_FULL_44_12b]
MITTEQIKELREETGLSIMQCQKALEEAGGDKTKAVAILKAKGAEIASKKVDRILGAGVVISYIHAGETVGVLVELLCETDFVAKNPEFKSVAKDIAMHIAAMKPENLVELLCETDFVAKNPEFKSVAKDIAMHIAAMKPENTAELLEQPFIKDPGKKISDIINNTVQKFGERTEVGHFVRLSI